MEVGSIYARVTIGRIKLDKIDEAAKVVSNSVIPAAKAQPGYCGIYNFTSRTSGAFIAISFWKYEADAIANEQSGYLKLQISKIQDFLAEPVKREGYDVENQDGLL